MIWLSPKFEGFPHELLALTRWVVWDDEKIPYDPKALKSNASVTDSSTWGTFDQAQTAYFEGGWCGVGFVLNGDGLVGVDIDKCFVDGTPDPRAICLLEELDAAFIEISPSGKGLRAFGYAKPLRAGRRGLLNGLNAEFYSTKRYLTVTGNTIKCEPLREFNNFAELAGRIGRPTEDTESNSSVSSVSSVEHHLAWPIQSIPTQVGQRNTKLFELARWLKGIEPNATKERQHQLVRSWFEDHQFVIGTHEFWITWADWQNAWTKVEHPYGETLDACLAKLPVLPDIEGLDRYGEKGKHLLSICAALQLHQKEQPFFISVRKAGELIDTHPTSAATLLSAFVAEGWLNLVSKGKGVKASRYLWNKNLIPLT